MNARSLLFVFILPLFFLGNSCLLTDESGVFPANSVRADEVGRRVMRQTAPGWFAGAHAYTVARDLGKITSHDHFLPAFAMPLAAQPESFASETVYYTGPSVKLCLFSARSFAYSAAFLTMDYLDVKQIVTDIAASTTDDDRKANNDKLDFAVLMSSYMAIGAAEKGCRKDLIRTGRLIEADRGRL